MAIQRLTAARSFARRTPQALRRFQVGPGLHGEQGLQRIQFGQRKRFLRILANQNQERQSNQQDQPPNGLSSNSHFNTTHLSSRHFHTTKTLGAPKDPSTIDFAYMPQLSSPAPRREWISVPFLPDNFAPVRSAAVAEVTDTAVLRPEISTAALESTHAHAPSAMSEVTDNAAIRLNPFDLTQTVNGAAVEAASKLGAHSTQAALEEAGSLREVWSGFLDDLLGAPKPKSA